MTEGGTQDRGPSRLALVVYRGKGRLAVILLARHVGKGEDSRAYIMSQVVGREKFVELTMLWEVRSVVNTYGGLEALTYLNILSGIQLLLS